MQVDSYGVGQYVKVIDNVFNEKTLDTFYRICKLTKFEDAEIGGGSNAGVNRKIRNTDATTFSRYNKNLTQVHWCNFFIKETAEAIQRHYKPIVPHLTFNLADNIQVLRYTEGGFYTPHVDHFTSIPRTISIIIFVNDDFEGGDFEMFSPDGKHSQKIEPKKGRMIVFPSNFLYPHKANIVTKGTRYAIVIWNL